MRKLVFTILLFVLTYSLIAQNKTKTDTIKTQELEEVVVSANKFTEKKK